LSFKFAEGRLVDAVARPAATCGVVGAATACGAPTATILSAG
jgi:hypothetical protein